MHTLSWKNKKGEYRKQPLQQYPPLNTAGLNHYATDQKNRPARKNSDNRSTLYKPDTSLRPPSTRIWIFFNPQIFLSGFKNFHVHAQRIQIELSRPQVREITLISSAGLKSDLRLMRKTFSLYWRSIRPSDIGRSRKCPCHRLAQLKCIVIIDKFNCT